MAKIIIFSPKMAMMKISASFHPMGWTPLKTATFANSSLILFYFDIEDSTVQWYMRAAAT